MNLLGSTSVLFGNPPSAKGPSAVPGKGVPAVRDSAAKKDSPAAEIRESTTAIFRYARKAVHALLGSAKEDSRPLPDAAARADWARIMEAVRGNPAWTYDRVAALMTGAPDGVTAFRMKCLDLDAKFHVAAQIPETVPSARHSSLDRARAAQKSADDRWGEVCDAAEAHDVPRALAALLARFRILEGIAPALDAYDRRATPHPGGFVDRGAFVGYAGSAPDSPVGMCVARLRDAGVVGDGPNVIASLEKALALESYYTAFILLQKRSLTLCDAALVSAFPPLRLDWAQREFVRRRVVDGAYCAAVNQAKAPFSHNAEKRLVIFERQSLRALGFEAAVARDLAQAARRQAAEGRPVGSDH